MAERGEVVRLERPGAMVAGGDGGLWIADRGRLVGADADGAVHTIVTEAGDVSGLALAGPGALLVADAAAGVVRCIELSSGRTAVLAAVPSPAGLAADLEGGVVYVAAAATRQIWAVALDGAPARPIAGGDDGAPARPIAGQGDGADAGADGPCATAGFAAPAGLALSPDRRRLYVADGGAVRVILLDEGVVATVAAGFSRCVALVVTPAGLAVTDAGAGALWGVNPRHGSTVAMWRDRDGLALAAPAGVTLDRPRRRYLVADSGADRLVQVATDASAAVVVTLRHDPATSATIRSATI